MSSGDTRSRLIRFGLWYLAVTTAYVAIWILIAPKDFYNNFPTGSGHWVDVLPPYNEHLERDFGAASLGLTVLAALAAIWWRERRLVQAAAIVFLVASLPHLIYHLTTTGHYSTSDNVQSLVGLALPAVISLGILWASREPRAVA